MVGLPSIQATQLPIITTAAQSIFNETTLGWLDRQDELRNWMRWGQCQAANAGGAGADLALKAPPVVCPDGGPGVWMKTLGSLTDRTTSFNPGSLLAAVAPGAVAGAAIGLPVYDLSYKQNTYATYGGLDFGKERIFAPYDSWITGIMAGYINSSLNFKASPTTFRFTGGTVGVSGTYLSGGSFFADGLVKADFLQLHSNFPGLAQFSINPPARES